MIFLFQHFFLLAIDLLLAMTLSCLFYAFVCISIMFLTCFVIIFSFGIVERNIDVKGRAIVILVSNSSIGRMFARNLDKAGFRVSAAHWPPREEGISTEEEWSSSMEVAQLHMTEEEYQKTMKTFIESHLSLKGSAEEGHLESQSTHHKASPTADTLQREASSRPEVPAVRSCVTLRGLGYIPPFTSSLQAPGTGALHTNRGFQTKRSAAHISIEANLR
ncbi:uncharacterized protein M6G45_003234 isoform 2-T2 [Spheniscus humboldti]